MHIPLELYKSQKLKTVVKAEEDEHVGFQN